MFKIEYICSRCGKKPSDNHSSMLCKCGGDIRGQSCGINGTRDSFGIGKNFRDERTGKEIDNWRSWERAGFRDPLSEGNLTPMMRDIVKTKRKAIKHGKNRSIHLKDV